MFVLKPMLLKAHLAFSKQHLEKGEAFWLFILWSQETKLELSGHMGTAFVWRTKARKHDGGNCGQGRMDHDHDP